jgi:transposase
MRFVAGVDCHKHSHTIVVLDHLGVQQGHWKITADPAGYEQALDAVITFSELEWGVESTGFYGYGFAQALVARGYVVFEVPGAVTKRHRRQGTRRGKSDPIDARAIAEAVLRERDRLPRFERNDARDAIRLLYDRRDRLVKERTTAGNRLRALALRLGLTDLPRELWSERRLRALRTRLEPYRGVSLTADALVDEFTEAIVDIERTSDRIHEIERRLRPFVERAASGLLRLRSVATIVAAGLFGHAGSLRNCRNANAFAMRAGVAPLTFASGMSAAVRVNNLGDRQLNRCLHVMAMTQIRLPAHPGRVYYDRKRAEGKTHRAALRALKRQLATITYYRLRDESALSHAATSEPISSAA